MRTAPASRSVAHARARGDRSEIRSGLAYARRAGGKRLAAIDDGDYPMRQRSLCGVWRMTTVYRSPPDDSIVIVSVARHIDGANPNATLAAIFPGLSDLGRRRSEQPPRCDDPQAPLSWAGVIDPTLPDYAGVERFDVDRIVHPEIPLHRHPFGSHNRVKLPEPIVPAPEQ